MVLGILITNFISVFSFFLFCLCRSLLGGKDLLLKLIPELLSLVVVRGACDSVDVGSCLYSLHTSIGVHCSVVGLP